MPYSAWHGARRLPAYPDVAALLSAAGVNQHKIQLFLPHLGKHLFRTAVGADFRVQIAQR